MGSAAKYCRIRLAVLVGEVTISDLQQQWQTQTSLMGNVSHSRITGGLLLKELENWNHRQMLEVIRQERH
ncbi:hypothetical protein TNIN_416651 [Trichonephila inaurata madagascariensis]|uniref:Uncharacterized protein n=1 Tax=Trichonephila inaurata madagascariensis TaxID=2747483 RepID=A0A8X6YMM9_9ARAC|nr:hypothetical protein TNIN_416651 [Trichonephila inaurata madagascariensis]